MRPVIKPCGDSAFTLVFGREISPEINRDITLFCRRLRELAPAGMTEIVPAYCAVTVHFDPTVTDPDAMAGLLSEIEISLDVEDAEYELVEIPVCYGGDLGPDLCDVAAHAGISTDEVIRRHSGAEYLIYMLGFTPGFPYMGGMDPSIATPRLESPRTLIPAGSVGIAGGQTGVYPIDSPGGWRLIGRTPLRLFDLERDEPFLLKAGQRVRFVPIDREEYERLAVK